MNLTIKTTHTTEREISISLPAFYKKITGTITEYVGILEPETMVKIFHCEMRTSMSNETTEYNHSEIASIHSKFDLGTEEEFFELYNKAMKSLTLTPQIQYFVGEGGIVAK